MLEHGSRLKSFKNNGRDLDVLSKIWKQFEIFIFLTTQILSIQKDLRRRRTESSIELRKQKKDDQVLKRRNIASFVEEEPLNDKTNAVSPPQPRTFFKPEKW